MCRDGGKLFVCHQMDQDAIGDVYDCYDGCAMHRTKWKERIPIVDCEKLCAP